jgi:hypothetical protein
MDNPILSVRLFGSHARGDAENSSDLDFLCILDTVTNKKKAAASSLIYAAYGKSVSITFYGRNRFGDMFKEGHLFAWHIFKESCFLPGFTDQDWIAQLGAPLPYTDAIQDVRDLVEIMTSIPWNLEKCPANTIYEAGLFYLCLRNIAISLSWHSPTGLNFSRFAPFCLTDPLVVVPLSLNRYHMYLQCRLASTRGLAVEPFDSKYIREDVDLCSDWCANNIKIVQGNEKA